MDAISRFQRRGRRPSTKLEDLLIGVSANGGLSTQSFHSGSRHSFSNWSNHSGSNSNCHSKSTQGVNNLTSKLRRKSSSLDNLTSLTNKKSSKKKSKKKDKVGEASSLNRRSALQRTESEKLIDLYQDTHSPDPSSRYLQNATFPLSPPLVGKPSSSSSLFSTSSKKKDKKSKTKKKASRRNSLPELSEHSRSSRLEDLSKHSSISKTKDSNPRNKKKSGSGGRRKSLTDIPKPLDRFFKNGKSVDPSSKKGESSSSTDDTAPSTPGYMNRPALEVNITARSETPDLDATATSALSNMSSMREIQPISEDAISASTPKKSSSRSSSKKSSSSRKLNNKDKEKDKKKSKKEKKQKKSSKATKEKDKRKKPKKAKSGSLHKHFNGSQRSIGSFSRTNSFNSHSFGSQRSLGSYVSECPTTATNSSFISFVSVNVQARRKSNDDALGSSSNHSHRSHRSIRKVRMDRRKVPLVSMPEHSISPNVSRRAFNDNFNASTHSMSLRDRLQISPGLMAGSSPGLMREKSLSQLTPTTCESSTINSSSHKSNNNSNGNPSTPNSRYRFQMVPKSQSFCEPMARWSPKPGQFFPTTISAPSLSERTGSRTVPMTGLPNAPSPTGSPSHNSLHSSASNSFLKPKTSFCSPPKATHPNQSVTNAWASPFDNADVKYAGSKEYKQTAKSVRDSSTKSGTSRDHSGGSSGKKMTTWNKLSPPGNTNKSGSSTKAKRNSGSSTGKSRLAIKTTKMSPMTIKKPPSEAFADTRSECSEDSEIDDPWENYGPASLMRASTYPNNANDKKKNDLSTSGRTNYSDDISALTMSLSTDMGSTSSPVGGQRNYAHGRRNSMSSGGSFSKASAGSASLSLERKTSMERRNSAPSKPQRRVRPRSPSPPRLMGPSASDREDDDESISNRERFMQGYDVSGTEGSISLHDCSLRSERSSVEKITTRPRKNKNPTVPRVTTPPRIRFGEGASESPRPKDQSPLMPRRRVSEHDRGDEPSFDNNNKTKTKTKTKNKTVMGIPVAPHLFESSSSNDVGGNFKLGDIEEVEEALSSHSHSHSNKGSSTSASHGICDDADAAAGNPTKNNGGGKVKSFDADPRKPPEPAESFSTHSHRVGALIESFEALDGHRQGKLTSTPSTRMSRSPSPSFRKRPKGLQPMLPSEMMDMMDVVKITRSPSMPVSPKTSKKLPPRHNSDLNSSSHHSSKKNDKKSKRMSGGKTTMSTPSPKTPAKATMKLSPTKQSMKLSPTKMSVKTKTTKNLTASDHSKDKEVICGTSSDFHGPAQISIRDFSYHKSDDDLTEKSAMSTTKKKTKKKPGVIRRRSSTGNSGIPPPSPRNRSKSPRKFKAKKKASSDDENSTHMMRRASVGKGTSKPEKRERVSRNRSTSQRRKRSTSQRRRSPSTSQRHRSKTPESKYSSSRASSDDDSPRKVVLSSKHRSGTSSLPTTPVGGVEERKVNRKIFKAPATVGARPGRGREAMRGSRYAIPELPLVGRGFAPPPTSPGRTLSSSLRGDESHHRSRKSRSPGRNFGKARRTTSAGDGSLSKSRSPGRSKSPGSMLPRPPKESIFGGTPRKSKKAAKEAKKAAKEAKKASSSSKGNKGGGGGGVIGVDDKKSGFQPPFGRDGIKA